MTTRDLITTVLRVWQQDPPPPRHLAREIDQMRRELRRRETLGFDDPFESPYPEVTW